MLGATPATPSSGSLATVFPDTAVVDSQIKTLESDNLARQVIDELDLWNDPEFANDGGNILARLFGAGASADAPDTNPEGGRDAVVANFKRATRIVRSGGSYVAEVSFSALRPEKAAAAANALAAAYVAYQNGTRERD